jgi:lipopolysaccharide/colanic/teichoic acid biosynthesis glycosyltransferase
LRATRGICRTRPRLTYKETKAIARGVSPRPYFSPLNRVSFSAARKRERGPAVSKCMEAYDLSTDRSMVTTDSTVESFARRSLDLVAASVLLLLLLPVMIGVAVAIRLDSSGPALFRQRRVGYRQREFTVYKFRSMRLDADEERHRQYVSALIGGGADAGEGQTGGEDLYKLAVDDRITPVGRRIRSWSVDELPQLFNVVLGDMSLVGPRPAIPYEVASYPAWYAKRFAVKPGLTGLWQVSGRNQRTYEEMVSLDIDYAEHRSFLGDLAILARTPKAVLGRKGVA